MKVNQTKSYFPQRKSLVARAARSAPQKVRVSSQESRAPTPLVVHLQPPPVDVGRQVALAGHIDRCLPRYSLASALDWMMGGTQSSQAHLALEAAAHDADGRTILAEQLSRIGLNTPLSAELFELLRPYAHEEIICNHLCALLMSHALAPSDDLLGAQIVRALAPLSDRSHVHNSLEMCLANARGATQTVSEAMVGLLASPNTAAAAHAFVAKCLEPTLDEELREAVLSSLGRSPKMLAHLSECFVYLRWNSPYSEQIFAILLRNATNSSVANALVQVLALPHNESDEQQQKLFDALVVAAQLPSVGKALLDFYVNRMWSQRYQMLALAALCRSSEHGAVYEPLLDYLRANRGAHEKAEQIRIVLKAAAHHEGAREGITQRLTADAWSADAAYLAFELLTDIAVVDDVLAVYRELLAQQEQPEIQLENLQRLPGRALREARQAVYVDRFNRFTDPQMFMTALYVVEEFQQRRAALLAAEDIGILRQWAEPPHTFAQLYQNIRAVAPASRLERAHWFVWTTESALAPTQHTQLATNRTLKNFCCAICYEDKPGRDAFASVSCSKLESKTCCRSCAQNQVLKNETAKFRDACPCGCGSALAIQDLVALRVPPEHVLSAAARLANEQLSKRPDWMPCTAADCLGGALRSTDLENINKCIICDTIVVPKYNPLLVAKMLASVGNVSSLSYNPVRSCFHCGVATEKNGGCPHMSCTQCKGEWNFYFGNHNVSHVAAAAPSDYAQHYRPAVNDTLSDLGLYEGLPHGFLNAQQVKLLQARAAVHLAKIRAELRASSASTSQENNT